MESRRGAKRGNVLTWKHSCSAREHRHEAVQPHLRFYLVDEGPHRWEVFQEVVHQPLGFVGGHIERGRERSPALSVQNPVCKRNGDIRVRLSPFSEKTVKRCTYRYTNGSFQVLVRTSSLQERCIAEVFWTPYRRCASPSASPRQ